MCVRLMLPGEVAALSAAWPYCYEGRADAPAGLAPGTRVAFEVELASFEREPHAQALSGAERLERGGRLKEQGNALYKQARRCGREAGALQVLAGRQAGRQVAHHLAWRTC